MWIKAKISVGLLLAGLGAAAPESAGGASLTSTPAQDAATWEKTVRKLRTRQMPPPGMPKPDEATYRALTSSIEHELDQLAAAKPNPGRTGAGGLTVGARARLRAGEFAELG